MHIGNIWRNWVQDRQSILFKRMITVLGVDMLVKLSGIILLPVFLRLMTQEEYGLYAYLLSIIVTFSTVLNFGLYIPLGKFYHDYQDKQDRGRLLFTVSVSLLVILTCVVAPFYLFRLDYRLVEILFRNAFNYESYRGIVLLSVLMTVCNFTLTNYFYISEKINHVKKYNIWRLSLINLSSLSLLFMFPRQDSVKLRLEATYVTELILFAIYSYFLVKELVFKFDKKIIVRSLKLGLPVMLSSTFGIVINFSDKFFLEKYVSLSALSTYYLAVSCTSVIPLIYMSFQNAWLPIFLREKDIQRNVSKTKRVMFQLAAAFSVIAGMIYLLVWLLFLSNIFSSKYYDTLYVLPILLVTQIFAALVPLFTNYLVYFEKTHITSITGVIICMVTISLSLFLIPRFGIFGAALVSLACNICYFIIYYFIIRTYTRSFAIKGVEVKKSYR
jgi:O-antigen/teichoic acid export membrane protein